MTSTNREELNGRSERPLLPDFIKEALQCSKQND